MNTKLKVKTESLPERCEICHQSDLFDPQRNQCSRCSGIDVKPVSSLTSSGSYITAITKARSVQSGGIYSLIIIAANFLLWNSINGLTILGAIVGAVNYFEGRRILKILQNVNCLDPDWEITRKRSAIGMTIGGIASLLGFIWMLIWSVGNR